MTEIDLDRLLSVLEDFEEKGKGAGAAITCRAAQAIRVLRMREQALREALSYWLPDETYMREHFPATDAHCKKHWAKFYDHARLAEEKLEIGVMPSGPVVVRR